MAQIFFAFHFCSFSAVSQTVTIGKIGKRRMELKKKTGKIRKQGSALPSGRISGIRAVVCSGHGGMGRKQPGWMEIGGTGGGKEEFLALGRSLVVSSGTVGENGHGLASGKRPVVLSSAGTRRA